MRHDMPHQYWIAYISNKKILTVLIKIRDKQWGLWFISHFYLSWVVQWALKVSDNIPGITYMVWKPNRIKQRIFCSKPLTGKPMTKTSGRQFILLNVHCFTFEFFWNVHFNDAFRPFYRFRPVGIRVSFDILSIEPISGESMNFKVRMFLNMRWNDPRLKFQLQGNKSAYAHTVPSDLWPKLWIPDVFISNEEG